MRTRPNLVVMLVMLDGWVMIRLISFGDYTTCYHIIYIYYIIHSNNDNNDDHIMMVINNNNNKVIYIHMNILEIIIVLGIMLLTNQWTVE